MSMAAEKKTEVSPEILETLGDFTSKENWDKFFTIRGSDDSFEWYSEWPEIKDSLLPQLFHTNTFTEVDDPARSSPRDALHILIPGCGSSTLSENLYDSGYHSITNIDFSTVVISAMLRRNVRLRPKMRWRVMDMTSMRFARESFSVVIDKGGFDALMEPRLGSDLGKKYLLQVKNVLKLGGKFVCFTLAESHVLALIFSFFRFGWKLEVLEIPHRSKKSRFQTFMVVVEKEFFSVVREICSSFNQFGTGFNILQARDIRCAIEIENLIRGRYISENNVVYAIEDLQMGAKGDISELHRGRRCKVSIGGEGISRFSYESVLLDAKDSDVPFKYIYGVFIVPKRRASEWIFSDEEGQWIVVKSSKVGRLLIVFLDFHHCGCPMAEIQEDLSPLVRQLAPGTDDNVQIPFMAAGDGVRNRRTIHDGLSSITGSILVEDVVYHSPCGGDDSLPEFEDSVFRRLIFKRTEGMVQSEALLLTTAKSWISKADNEEMEMNMTDLSSPKSKRKGRRQKKNAYDNLKIDHGFLASKYHSGIVAGFMLISVYLDGLASSGKMVRAVVVGLGAGVLPMFLNKCFPFLDIDVVELDPDVLKVAQDFFGFSKDVNMKVHIADGIRFVDEIGMPKGPTDIDNVSDKNGGVSSPSDQSVNSQKPLYHERHGVDILIIDVDSSDPSSGMSCPAPDFVEEAFMFSVKRAMSEKGLFVLNLVCRSRDIKSTVIERIKSVFENIFCIELEEDVNIVLFALKKFNIDEYRSAESAVRLQRLVEMDRHHHHPSRTVNFVDVSKRIERLK